MTLNELETVVAAGVSLIALGALGGIWYRLGALGATIEAIRGHTRGITDRVERLENHLINRGE